MQTGYKHQNTIKLCFISHRVIWLIRLSLFPQQSAYVEPISFVNNSFIAAPCVKVDNTIALDILLVCKCGVFFSKHSDKIQQIANRLFPAENPVQDRKQNNVVIARFKSTMCTKSAP